ncbi:hypothetical protein [Nostoc sp.]
MIPLQPGHGRSGDWRSQNPPPLPTDIEIYQQFVIKWLQIAKTLGQQVVIGGLSTGGTCRCLVSFEHPEEIERTLLFTPYLGSRYLLFNQLIKYCQFTLNGSTKMHLGILVIKVFVSRPYGYF